MKVICIDGKRKHVLTTYDLPEGIPLDVYDSDQNGYYIVKGYEIDVDGILTYWNKNRFIPLSEIDETELIKERELVNA